MFIVFLLLCCIPLHASEAHLEPPHKELTSIASPNYVILVQVLPNTSPRKLHCFTNIEKGFVSKGSEIPRAHSHRYLSLPGLHDRRGPRVSLHARRALELIGDRMCDRDQLTIT